MGSPSDEPDRRTDEDQTAVTLSQGFWIGRFEVTQRQWLDVMQHFPDRLPEEQWGLGDIFPVYWVNFKEAEQFCIALTDRLHESGQLPGDWEFRLPTEAQWEYACRAGTTTAGAFGPTLRSDQANFVFDSPDDPSVKAHNRATPVGSYPPNAWGIHDMHGNIFEWCRDWYHAALPGGTDPDLYDRPGVPNRDGSYSRVRRGGAWNDPAMYCRSAMRLRYEPVRRSDHISFRIALVQE